MFSLYVHLNSGGIQSNRLARAFDFAVRYTKGEEKVCVLDRNHWLAKMPLLLHHRVFAPSRCDHLHNSLCNHLMVQDNFIFHYIAVCTCQSVLCCISSVSLLCFLGGQIFYNYYMFIENRCCCCHTL